MESRRTLSRSRKAAAALRQGEAAPDRLALRPEVREAAARDLASIEGWMPDSISGKGRPIWEAYAEHLDKTVAAINAAMRETA